MSAAVRLMPSPPALVLSRKTKISVLQRPVWGGEEEEGDRKKSKDIIYSGTVKKISIRSIMAQN